MLLSWLQIIDNPHQDIPLLSVLLSPVEGFEAEQAARVRAGRRGGDYYGALLAYSAENDEFAAFLNRLEQLRAASRQEH
ncbi:MAG: hypothetical protein IKT99_04675, partial [Oscillospiraceae bacterium]|nr:hypothetical protein [Oscillospiraceae bacterium]